MAISTLIAPYDPEAKLADIPWDALPLPMQQTCHRFIDEWWNSLDPDQPIEASGLSDMTLAQVAALQEREAEQRAPNRFRLITFLRVESEDDEPMTYKEALAEKEQQELMCPENIHRIEEIPHP